MDQPFTWTHSSWVDRLAAFNSVVDPLEKLAWPFPMAVFGTLRNRSSNNHLMRRATIARHHKAFLPHFVGRGLGVYFQLGGSCPFEIFEYEPVEWGKMIPRVDRLEGFDPPVAVQTGNDNYYFRTLMAVRVLPDEFVHDLFPEQGSPLLGSRPVRSLGLPPDTWHGYKTIPCWVYSSVPQNRQVTKEVADGPVLWSASP